MPADSQNLCLYHDRVKPEYIDKHGHMDPAYYVLLFDEATDKYKSFVGLTTEYRLRTGCSTFAAELHVCYLRELVLGDEVRVETTLLDYDEKRHHFIHSMIDKKDDACCATMEVMSMHVDLNLRKVTPFPAPIKDAIATLVQQHADLDRPGQTGHVIGVDNPY